MCLPSIAVAFSPDHALSRPRRKLAGLLCWILTAAALTASLLPPNLAAGEVLRWSTDVGAVGSTGNSSYDDATQSYHLAGAGLGLAGTADAFHFAYYNVVRGDGQMTVRLTNTGASAQAALLLRDSLDPDAASAAVVVQNGVARFVRRANASAGSTVGGANSTSVPCWLRISRSGSTVSAAISTDGQTWMSLGSDTVNLESAGVYVGLALSNGLANATTTASASFDAVQSTFLPGEGLQLWLKADAGLSRDAYGRIASWADQSGQGHHASQTDANRQPSYVAAVATDNNSQPAVRFDGSQSVLSFPGSYGQDNFTVFAVTRPAATHEIDGESASGIAGARGQSYLFGGFMGNDEAGPCLSVGTNGVSVYEHAGDYLPALSVYAGELGVNYHCVGLRYQAKQAQILVDGALKHIGLVSPRTHVDAPGSLGFGAYGTYAGDVAEVLVYDRALEDAEYQAVEAYLNAKYRYNSAPPAPVQVVATPVSANQGTLCWTGASTSVTGYRVEQQNGDGSWTTVATLDAAQASYLATGLAAGTAYSFRIVAFNALGDSPAASITLTTPATGATWPVGDLRLWLRADTGAVADGSGLVGQWLDRSGLGNHALQAAPSQRPTAVAGVLNGQPVLRFDGVSSNLQLDAGTFSGLGAGELFVVLRAADLYTHNNGSWGFNDAYDAYYPHDSGAIYENFGTNSRYGPLPPPVPLDQFNFYDVAAAPGEWTLRMNGETAFHSDSNTPTFSSNAYRLGRNNTAHYLSGDIAEVLIFDRVLSPAERAALEAYLNGKYAVLSSPSAPANFYGAVISPTQANLFWTASSTVTTGYSLERKPTMAPDSDYVAIASLPGGRVQSYIDNGLASGTDYAYRLRAFNPAGSSGYSTTVALTTPSAGASSLPTGDLLLWLRPETGVTQDANGLISDWTDASGHGYNASAPAGSRPLRVDGALNGQPVVRFNGSSSYLRLPSGFSDFTRGMTALVVAKPTSNAYYARFFDLGNGAGQQNIVLARYGSTDLLEFYSQNSPIDLYANGLTSNQYQLLGCTQDPTVQTVSLYKNGIALAQGSAGPIVNTPRNSNFIGKDNWDLPLYQGDIAEMLLFDRALSEQERQVWEHYLNAKYQYDPPPPAPSQLIATAVSASQCALSWIDPLDNISGYRIERQNADGTWSFVATVNAGTTSYTVTGLNPGVVYQFRVVAINHTGESPAAMVSVTLPANTLPFPAGSLRLWLRANSGLIMDADGLLNRWTDQSGHGFLVTQNSGTCRPAVLPGVLNGQPVVHFDGSDDYLTLPGGVTSGLSATEAFVVLRASDPVVNVQRGFWYFGSGNIAVYPWYDSRVYDTFGTTSQYGFTPSVPLDQFNLYNVSAAADHWTARLNGEVQVSSATNTVGFAGGPYYLGSDRDGRRFAGDVAEVLVFDHALSEAERQSVEHYLNGVYGIVSPSPAPTNLNAAPISSTQANLLWTPAPLAQGYSLERKSALADDTAYVEVASIAGGEVRAYVDGNLLPEQSYTYRLRAYNLAGFSAYSAPVSVTLPAVGQATLPADDLLLWLRPETGVTQDANGLISRWVDASGHGNDGVAPTGSQPQWVDGALNGQPVVRFNGSSYLRLPSGFSDFTRGMTALVVAKPTSQARYARFFDLGNGAGQENILLARQSYADGLELYSANTQFELDATTGLTLNTYQLVGAELDPVAHAATVYQNGVAVGTSPAGAIVNVTRTSNFIARSNWADPLFQGDIAEVLLFDHALGDSERRVWERYLNAKYNYDPVPTAPTRVLATALSSTQILVSWCEDFENVTGYRVERQNPDGSWSIVATLNGGGTCSAVDGSLTPGTAYQYRVLAFNRTGDSPPSPEVTGRTSSVAGDAFPASSLRFWLSAGAGVVADANGRVSVWNDQSDHGTVATAQGSLPNRPQRMDDAVNGQAIIHFAGQGYFTLPDVFAGASAAEMVIVTAKQEGSNGYNSLDGFAGYYGDRFYQGNFYSDFGSTDEHVLTGAGLNLPALNLLDLSSQQGLWQSWINGVAQVQSTSNTVLLNPAPLLGRSPNGSILCGDIAEVLLFDHVLSAPERHAVERYCAGRYALASFLGGPGDADPDGDGRTTLQEYLDGTDPLDYYNGQVPTVTIVSGNLQGGTPGALAADALVVKAATADGSPLANAPLVFQVARGAGWLADPASPTALSRTVTVRTGVDGNAAVRFQLPAAGLSFTSLVRATASTSAGSAHATFAEAVVADDDASGDGLRDGWKLQYGFDLAANNAAGDPDGDGLTNQQEFYLSTNPLVADYTPEGVAVGWMVAHGLDPRYDSPDALDPNGKGLTYLQEYRLERSTLDLWPFDEGADATTVASLLGYGDVGTLANLPAWVADPDGGGALRFNLPGARVDFGSPSDGHLDFGAAGSFSVSARFRSGATGTARLLGKGDVARSGGPGYFLNLEDGRLGFGVGADAGQGNPLHLVTIAVYNDGGWHHVAGVFDRAAQRARIYVDGVLQPVALAAGSTGTVLGSEVDLGGASNLHATNAAAALSVGSDDAAGHEQFWGPMDNVGLFNRALSAAEVKVLAGTQFNQPPVVVLTSPAPAAVFPEGGSIPIQAQAYSPAGAMAKVEFFAGGTKLGEAATAPYGLNWQAAAGSYDLLAKATDARGATSTSTPVNLSVAADSDHDGLPDAWELQRFGNLDQGANGSFLGDGVSNLTKYLLGLDPTRPVSTDSAATSAVGLQVFTPLR